MTDGDFRTLMFFENSSGDLVECVDGEGGVGCVCQRRHGLAGEGIPCCADEKDGCAGAGRADKSC